MEITLFEAFAGIGAQHKALKNLQKKGFNIEYKIKAICEWDINANSSYLAIHGENKTKEKNICGINKKDFFDRIAISNDGKVPISERSNKLKKFKDQIYEEFKKTNNLSDITNVYDRYVKLNGFDEINVFTYSFPCQDLSSAGNIHGFNKGVIEGTRSGLLLEVEKLVTQLQEKDLPKYLLMENVNNLVSQKHYASFERWINKLKSLGYSTYWGVLDSNKLGTLQKRKRVFAISVKDGKGNIYNDLDQRIEKIYLDNKNSFPNERLKEIIDIDNSKFPEEAKKFLMKDTPSRKKMVKQNKEITAKTNVVSTVTTKQDRNPNTGFIRTNINKEDYLKERFITPREAYKLMGFEDKDFEKAAKKSTPTLLYKQAGNSIVVRKLELIFLFILSLEED